jgi:signal transduction histidine kinase
VVCDREFSRVRVLAAHAWARHIDRITNFKEIRRMGIPPEDLPRIFDPGFTTRGVGVGTGLGLSTSCNILKNHGARALVDSEIGKGTRFTIVLPIDHAGAGGAPRS